MRMRMRYRMLDAARVVETVEKLERRITERFPESGLTRVASELLAVGREAQERCRKIRSAHLGLRFFICLLLASAVAVGAYVVRTVLDPNIEWRPTNGSDLMQEVEAILGTLVFLGAAIAYLFSLETRSKRKKALQAIHVLRSLAHIVDMHQLTKDPDRVLAKGPSTASSPERTMTAFELGRYLDYCSEMLALISKIGALYVQDFADSVAVTAVDEIEGLTTGLSRKVWQKIQMIDRSH